MYRSNLAHRGTSLIQQSKKMCLFLLVLHENKVNVGERVETTGNVFAEIPLDYHLTSQGESPRLCRSVQPGSEAWTRLEPKLGPAEASLTTRGSAWWVPAAPVRTFMTQRTFVWNMSWATAKDHKSLRQAGLFTQNLLFDLADRRYMFGLIFCEQKCLWRNSWLHQQTSKKMLQTLLPCSLTTLPCPVLHQANELTSDMRRTGCFSGQTNFIINWIKCFFWFTEICSRMSACHCIINQSIHVGGANSHAFSMQDTHTPHVTHATH